MIKANIGKTIIEQKNTATLTERQQEIVTMLEKYNSLSLSEISANLEKPIPNRTLQDELARLKKLKIISPTGIGRNTKWYLS